MWGKTANYMLNTEFVFIVGMHDSIRLAPGTFVRPVELRYVPKHVLEDDQWYGYSTIERVFCYTPKGFLLIPRSYLREVG